MSIDTRDTYPQAVISNMIETFTLLVQSARDKKAEVINMNDSICYYSGSDFFIFNGLFSSANIQENPQHHFSHMMDYFSSRQKPFTWWWIEQAPIPSIIQKELDYFKFESLGNYIGISIDLNSANFSSISNKITVKEVSTEKEYEDLINIIAEVFQFSPSVKLDYASMCLSYEKNRYLKHYLGYYDQKPMSTLTTYANHNVVGFYNGATLPSAQKHGICTALTQYALKHAKNLSNKIGISQLMASGMAKGISEKMGFKTSCILRPFVNHLKP